MPTPRQIRPVAAVGLTSALAAGVLLLIAAMPAWAADFGKAALDLRAKYASDIEQLAKWCDSKGLADEARKTRHRLPPSNPYKLYVPVLPDEVGPAKPPADASPDVQQWDSRLRRLRRDQATALYEIARHAVRSGHAGLAFDLAMLAGQTDPDYEPVRRLLGYQKFHDQWRTAYEVRQLRMGNVWSDKFGWLPKTHLARYEQGERYCNGRWISEAEDAKLHSDIHSGWDVQTEHYTIRTDHSIQAAVRLGVKLERLYRLWQQMFIRYYASEADVVSLFDGRARAAPTGPLHSVVYFRDRDDYNRALRPTMPNIGISVGVYVEQTARAYFFASQPSDDRTLYHEATHQLFHETRPEPPHVAVGRAANFWIVEGIAMFMESLRQEDGYYVLGGFDDDRMRAARFRLLSEGKDRFYVPLRRFTALGIKDMQGSPDIAKLYSQAAGLANFLVFYQGGRYRDALVSYLLAIYTGRDEPDSLARLTAAGYSQLDKQYRQYVQGGG